MMPTRDIVRQRFLMAGVGEFIEREQVGVLGFKMPLHVAGANEARAPSD